MKRAERLHALGEMLRRSRTRGRTADSLAEERGVSVRTIKRDLAALEHSGAPLWSRPGPGGGYGLAVGASLPPVSLSHSQAVALMAAVSAAPDAPYADLAQSAVNKIVDVLDPRTRQRADELADRVWINAAPAADRRVTSALEEAMADQRVLRLRFTSSAGITTSREVEPVLFAQVHGRWHLVGWCRLRDAMRWFAIDRIERASITALECSGHTIAEIGTPPGAARPVNRGSERGPD